MTAARTKRTVDRVRALFLEELAQRGNVSDACRAAGISRRQTVYEWRDGDSEFAALWGEALDTAIDAMEKEAHRRAFEGTDEPLIGRVDKDQDGIITHVRKYSDSLAQFLLKAHRPEKYRERNREDPTPPIDWDRVSEADQVAFLEGKISLADVVKRQQPRN